MRVRRGFSRPLLIKHWLLSAPGQFKSDVSKHDVLSQAWATSGLASTAVAWASSTGKLLIFAVL